MTIWQNWAEIKWYKRHHRFATHIVRRHKSFALSFLSLKSQQTAFRVLELLNLTDGPKYSCLQKTKAVTQTLSKSLRIAGHPHWDGANRWEKWAAPPSFPYGAHDCVAGCVFLWFTQLRKKKGTSVSTTKAQVTFASGISDIHFSFYLGDAPCFWLPRLHNKTCSWHGAAATVKMTVIMTRQHAFAAICLISFPGQCDQHNATSVQGRNGCVN